MMEANVGSLDTEFDATLGNTDSVVQQRSLGDEALESFRQMTAIADGGYSSDTETKALSLYGGDERLVGNMQAEVDNDDTVRFNSRLDQLKANPALFEDETFRNDLLEAHKLAGGSTTQWTDLEAGVKDWYTRRTAKAMPAEGLNNSEKQVLAKQQAAALNSNILTQKYIDMKYPGSIRGTVGNLLDDVTGSMFSIGLSNLAIANGIEKVTGAKVPLSGKVLGGDGWEYARDYVRKGANAKEQAERLDKIVNAVTRDPSNLAYKYRPELDPEPDAAFRNQLATQLGLPAGTTFGIDDDSFIKGANILESGLILLTPARLAFGKFFGKKDLPGTVNSKLLANNGKAVPQDLITDADLIKSNPAAIAKPRSYADINDTADEALTAVVDRVRANITKLGTIKAAPIYDEKIQQAVQADVISNLKDVHGATVRTDMTTLDETDLAGFKYTATYGHTDKVGFDDIASAQSLITHGQLPTDATIMKKVYGSNDMVPVTNVYEEATSGAGTAEYFVQVPLRRNYNPEDMKFWGTDALMNTGVLNNYLPLPPQARLTERLYNMASASLNSKGRVAEYFNNIVRDNFMKLPKADKFRVSQLLEQGDLEGRVYSATEIRALVPNATDKLVAGYIEARGFMDAQYAMANRMMRDQAERKGLSTFTHSSGLKFVGKEAKVGDLADNAVAYDAVSGSAVPKDSLRLLVDSGAGALYRADEVFQTAAGQSHTLVYVPNGSGMTKSAIPFRMLNYNVGQITRLYDENYFVRVAKTNQVDGVERQYEQAVGAFATKGEADEFASKYAQQNVGSSMIVTRDDKLRRALLEGVGDDTDMGGALFLSQRGPRLAGSDTNGRARIIDPIAALNVARDVSANRASMQEMYTAVENLIFSKFGRESLGDAAVAFKNENGLLSIAGDVTNPAYREAKVVYDWLQTMKYVDNIETAAWKMKFLDVAEWMEGKGMNRVAKMVADAEGVAPIAATKQATSWAMVLSSGPRQFIQNAMQTATLVGLYPVVATKALLLDGFGLSLGLRLKNSDRAYELYSKTIGRGIRMGKGEFDGLVTAYERSGLPFTVDSHTLLRGSDFKPEIKLGQSTATGRAVSTAGDVMGAVIGAPTTGLFKAGTHANYAATFMIAYKLLKSADKGFDITKEANAIKVGQKARMLLIDMSKINKVPALEEGAMSVALQFASFPIKSLAQFVNKNLTKSQRTRIALGAVAMYGATNPFGEHIESIMTDLGIPASDQMAKNFIDGGLTDMFFNMLVGTEDVAWSEFTNPYYGAVAFVSGIFDGGMYNEEGKIILSPAAFSLFGNIGKAINEVALLTQAQDISDPETLGAALNILGAGIISQWGRMEKAKLGMEIGAQVDASFDPSIRSSYEELLMLGTFGARTQRAIEAQVMQGDTMAAAKSRKQTVDAVSKSFIRVLADYGDDIESASAKLKQLEVGLVTALGTDGIMIVNDALKKAMAYNDAKGGLVDDKADKAFQSFWKGLNNGKMPESHFEQLYNSAVFQALPEEKQQAFRQMEQDILNKKGVSE